MAKARNTKAKTHDKAIAGMSIGALVVEFLGLLMLLVQGSMYGVGLIDILYIIGFGWVGYKVLYKKQALSLGEKVAFYILFSLISLVFLAGLLSGLLSSAYY